MEAWLKHNEDLKGGTKAVFGRACGGTYEGGVGKNKGPPSHLERHTMPSSHILPQ